MWIWWLGCQRSYLAVKHPQTYTCMHIYVMLNFQVKHQIQIKHNSTREMLY